VRRISAEQLGGPFGNHPVVSRQQNITAVGQLLVWIGCSGIIPGWM
jgi:hypothetical protein